MRSNRSIDHIDRNGQYHGYQEWYDRYHPMAGPSNLVVRLTYYYGCEIGYEEIHIGAKLCHYHII